jgi:hypothetical protein
MKRHVGPASLENEAREVFPAVCEMAAAHREGRLSDAELAACYVVAWTAVRSRQGLICGRREKPVVESALLDTQLDSLPCLLELAGGKEYFARKGLASLSLWQLFNRHHLKSVKAYVNECLVLWHAGARPAVLLFHIPTSEEVLLQQARGERVVTALVEQEELGRRHRSLLSYMESGDVNHERDPLDFLAHDLKHMEHFAAPESHAEQVGFFRAMSRLQPDVRRFFETRFRGDVLLWPQIEYVLADMNCFLPHLLKYLLAKLTVAASRSPQVCLGSIWCDVLDGMGMARESAARRVAERLATEQETLVLADFEVLRDWFKTIN